MGAVGLRDDFPGLDSADETETVTRVRLDDITGELIITMWKGNELISERRERPRED